MNTKLIQDEEVFETEPEAETHANKIEFSDTRNQLAVQMLKKMCDSITHVIHLLESGDNAKATRHLVEMVTHDSSINQAFETKTGSRVIEGVFDGVSMIGEDGIRYQVSENYASKSRLVEGDILKLTIQPDGTHVFKQIGPIERQKIVGRLHLEPSTQEYVVHCGDKVYKVLTASVSFFKGVDGDEVVIVVPRKRNSNWAAVENIISS